MSVSSVVAVAAALRQPPAGQPRTAPVLPEAVRILAAFAGIGAATLAFGLSSTFWYASSAQWPLYLVAAAAAAWALYLTTWSLTVFRRNRLAAVRSTVLLLCAASAACLGGISYTLWISARPVQLDLTTASLFVLQLIILASAGYLRRTAAEPVNRSSQHQAPAAPLLAALFAAALMVATITVPGLAATTAGEFAVPHSEHTLPGMVPQQGQNGHHGH